MHWDKTLLWILNIFKSLTASLLVAFFLVSCGGKEPVDPTPTPGPGPDPKPPVETKDTKAPTITVKITEKNVIAWVIVSVKDNQLLFDQTVAASWTDDISKSCKVELSLVPSGGQSKTINSGDKLEEAGTLQLKVIDEAGNSSSAEIKLTLSDTKAPEIDIKIPEKNVVAGVKISVQDNQLFFDQDVAATWKDDYSETFTTELYLFVDGCEPETINSGDVITKAGVFKIHVTDEFGNKSVAEISLTAVAITGLENLQNLSLQVDKEVNLLQGLYIAEGLSLVKVEIEQDGTRSVIPDASKYIPEVPGSINIILTLSRTDGSTIEVKVENLTVQGIQYQSLSITDLKPVEILPIIGQIEGGDKKAYDHIDHLRIAEATVIRDMMWKYWAGNYTIDEYQGFMDRLNIGIAWEVPTRYDNYELTLFNSVIGTNGEAGTHASKQWSILCSLIQHANPIVAVGSKESDGSFKRWEENLLTFIKQHPQSINIFWCSAYGDAYNEIQLKEWLLKDDILELRNEKSFLIYSAASNISIGSPWTDGDIIINKIYNSEYPCDEHGCYFLASLANSDKNTNPSSHIFVTVANQPDGNIDQTNEYITSSKFPIGFANNALFSWRAFPFVEPTTWKVFAEAGNTNNGKYSTSYTNPLNACMTGLCFQMFAEAADVDVLMEKIRYTCLTDHIHLDLNEDGDTNDIIDGHPETVPLQLINPGGFFKKYCMPSSFPTAIGTDETIDLEKGYYKGVVFNIPGAEVLVNGEWIPFTAENAIRIKATNPMNLEWRVNGALLRKYGYTPGQTLQGQIITVDDQWNGLRLEVPMSITIR